MTAAPAIDDVIEGTRWTRRDRPRGTPWALGWSELVAFWCSPGDLPAGGKDAAEGWSPTRFKDDHRRAENVIDVGAVVLDLDCHDDDAVTAALVKAAREVSRDPNLHPTVAEAVALLRDVPGGAARVVAARALRGEPDLDPTRLATVLAATLPGLRWAAHTTASSVPGAWRWRVLVPLARRVSAGEHAALVCALRLALFLAGCVAAEVDPAASGDPARLWYVPAAVPSYATLDGDGRPLDPDEALAEARATLAVPEGGDVAAALAAALDEERARTWAPLAQAGTVESAPARAAGTPWPTLDDAAYHGLAGEIVRTIEPHTEADPVAVLVQLLAAVGAWFGAGPSVVVGADRHPPREYVALVGATASGRKGTAWAEVKRVLWHADPEWTSGEGRRVLGGLSSGEGVIHAVRDAKRGSVKDKKTGEVREEVTDPGEPDKRLLVVEQELATVLARARRDTNTLSAILRQAWDTGDLAVLVRGGGQGGYRATGAHVGLVAHITREELLRVLDATEQANGFGNRFLWICARRSKPLPDGGSLDPGTLAGLTLRLQRAAASARARGSVTRTSAAAELWRTEYADLSAERPGLYGAMTARGAPHVLRLALIYALLDEAAEIDLPHLRAALAVWRYAAASVRWTWGDNTGDSTADAILAALRRSPGGLTRRELHAALDGHIDAGAMSRALAALHGAGLARCETVATGGRPAERWTARA